MIKVEKAGYQGIRLPQLSIGFDYNGLDSDYTFISHAHSDHTPKSRNASVYCTENTCKLMQLRGFKGEAEVLKFEESFDLPHARVTLYPAGHILGSAMVYIETDEGSVLYSGDYRTPPSLATEGFKCPQQADYFITEATYSLPIYKWLPNDEIVQNVQQFAAQTLHENYTPVFLAYNLGKAQEIMHMLAPLKLPVQIHEAGYNLCKVYEEAGIDLGNYELYNRETCEGKILITTGSALNNGFASNAIKKRVAYCSGWAVRQAGRNRLTVDKLIPLSDHLDFFELIDLCKKLNSKMVHITHTPNAKVVLYYLSNLNIKSSYLS